MTSKSAAELTLTTLRVEQHERVLTVFVNAPPFGFMTPQMQGDLLTLVTTVREDRSVGAVVLTGSRDGRFLTHFDIGHLLAAAESSPPDLPRPLAAAAVLAASVAGRLPGGGQALDRSPVRGIRAITRFHEIVVAIMRSPAVWIAAVNGPCGGGGLELIVHFDMRVAGRDQAAFMLPELLIGLTTTVGGQRIAQLVGPSKALEIMLEGRAYSADEALGMGLVSHAVADGEVLGTAQSLAARYSRRNRDVVAAQKRILNEAGALSPEESLRREGAAQINGVSTAVTRRALRRWLAQQEETGGDSVFLTQPEPWVSGEAVDLNPR